MVTIFNDVVSAIPTTSVEVMTDTVYASSIKLHIANALATLVQNGVGKSVNMFGEKEPTWDDFFGLDNDKETAHAKTFVYLQTQILFDPPQQHVLENLAKHAEESLWRARLEYDI